ncbi:MAG: HAMP domain-containing histidine kinase [Actinomycetota bacterium]|nr:HAMP domain-containing histidine kinase [Actinomycetota bacterium]
MSLKARIALSAGAAMAAAMLLISAVIFLGVRSQLRAQIDIALRDRAQQIAEVAARFGTPPYPRQLQEQGSPFPYDVPDPKLGGPTGLAQFVLLNGAVVRPADQDVVIPTDDGTREVARGRRPAFYSDMNVEGGHIRVLTTPFGRGVALQVARPLDEVDQVLARLVGILAALAVAGSVMAAGLARVVSSTALTPVRELTEAAEKVATTKDLAHRIAAGGSDELGRLASSFNAMLEALDASVKAQRQLVADASHELRTPLTSLRTNIEVLSKAESLSIEERQKLLADVVGQLDELTALMADLIDLARGDEPELEMEDVRLDLLTMDSVERAKRNWPHVRFVTELEETTVRAIPSRLERAIMNLLDNAAKWSEPNADVYVRVANGEMKIRDHGPGIAAADLPQVFDRFYRADDARGMPGSGLGLAIVRQVASAHGGSVTAENAEDGGAVLTLTLPAVS